MTIKCIVLFTLKVCIHSDILIFHTNHSTDKTTVDGRNLEHIYFTHKVHAQGDMDYFP